MKRLISVNELYYHVVKTWPRYGFVHGTFLYSRRLRRRVSLVLHWPLTFDVSNGRTFLPCYEARLQSYVRQRLPPSCFPIPIWDQGRYGWETHSNLRCWPEHSDSRRPGSLQTLPRLYFPAHMRCNSRSIRGSSNGSRSKDNDNDDSKLPTKEFKRHCPSPNMTDTGSLNTLQDQQLDKNMDEEGTASNDDNTDATSVTINHDDDKARIAIPQSESRKICQNTAQTEEHEETDGNSLVEQSTRDTSSSAQDFIPFQEPGAKMTVVEQRTTSSLPQDLIPFQEPNAKMTIASFIDDDISVMEASNKCSEDDAIKRVTDQEYTQGLQHDLVFVVPGADLDTPLFGDDDQNLKIPSEVYHSSSDAYHYCSATPSLGFKRAFQKEEKTAVLQTPKLEEPAGLIMTLDLELGQGEIESKQRQSHAEKMLHPWLAAAVPDDSGALGYARFEGKDFPVLKVSVFDAPAHIAYQFLRQVRALYHVGKSISGKTLVYWLGTNPPKYNIVDAKHFFSIVDNQKSHKQLKKFGVSLIREMVQNDSFIPKDEKDFARSMKTLMKLEDVAPRDRFSQVKTDFQVDMDTYFFRIEDVLYIDSAISQEDANYEEYKGDGGRFIRQPRNDEDMYDDDMQEEFELE